MTINTKQTLLRATVLTGAVLALSSTGQQALAAPSDPNKPAPALNSIIDTGSRCEITATYTFTGSVDDDGNGNDIFAPALGGTGYTIAQNNRTFAEAGRLAGLMT